MRCGAMPKPQQVVVEEQPDGGRLASSNGSMIATSTPGSTQAGYRGVAGGVAGVVTIAPVRR